MFVVVVLLSEGVDVFMNLFVVVDFVVFGFGWCIVDDIVDLMLVLLYVEYEFFMEGGKLLVIYLDFVCF